ncbi:MAG: TrmH family RNA methyltransferase, partial [Flavobacteriales bacterium]
MPEITKNQLKHIRLLKQKKYRQESGEFVVEGEKNVEELLNSNFEIQSLYATQDWNYSHESIEISRINSKQLSQLSNLSTPNKVFAIAKIPSWSFSKDILKKGITLVLDSINDPGNLGTIIRTADWFGVKNIICSSNSVDCFNPKVIQATKGSIFN